VASEELIEIAAQRLARAARAPAWVILFGSHARGEATIDSDLDFLVLQREVDDRIAEAVRLRRVLRGLRTPVDVVVMSEALAAQRARVPGTLVHRALREGRVVAES